MVGCLITSWVFVGSDTFPAVATLVVVPYAVDAPSVGIVTSDIGEVCCSKTIDGVFFVGTCVEGVAMAC